MWTRGRSPIGTTALKPPYDDLKGLTDLGTILTLLEAAAGSVLDTNPYSERNHLAKNLPLARPFGFPTHPGLKTTLCSTPSPLCPPINDPAL